MPVLCLIKRQKHTSDYINHKMAILKRFTHQLKERCFKIGLQKSRRDIRLKLEIGSFVIHKEFPGSCLTWHSSHSSVPGRAPLPPPGLTLSQWLRMSSDCDLAHTSPAPSSQGGNTQTPPHPPTPDCCHPCKKDSSALPFPKPALEYRQEPISTTLKKLSHQLL